MKKYTGIILGIALLHIQAIAQGESKTYQGVFGTGKATYQYYENEKSDRIYQGTFSYTGDLYTVIGKFLENQRSGKWTISAKNKVVLNEKKAKLQQNTLLTGKYSNGSMDSLWSYTQTVKLYNPKTKKPGTKPEKMSSKAFFANNHFTGNLTYEHLTPSGKLTCVGQFTPEGLPDGVWTFNTGRQVEEIRFKAGMIYARMKKDLTSGEKLMEYDSSEFIANFWKNYDPAQKMAVIGSHMYFIDTLSYTNEAIDFWAQAMHPIAGFGQIRSAIYDFKKGQSTPEVKQVRIITCDVNTDCYKRYEERKNAEAERLRLLQEEEDRKREAEILSREEEARKERERLAEEARKQEIANTIATARELFTQKKYKESLLVFEKANQMQPHDDVIAMNMIACRQNIQRIDSLQNVRLMIFNELKGDVNAAFNNSAETEADLKGKKKVYATNYRMCMDYLTQQFTPGFNEMQYIAEIPNSPERMNAWTDEDAQSLLKLQALKQELMRVSNFQKAVRTALTTNNKVHLRVLNSSLNPKVIVDDMIKFK